MNRLVFIVGPTAVGKTDMALQWAEQRPSCIINSDSIQVYKDLNIGSAKPDFKKYPHIPFHLFDQISVPQVWTAGEFRKQALQILKKEMKTKTALIVGGSGFYIQALEKGMYPVCPAPHNAIQKLEGLLKKKGLKGVYQDLKKKDPISARQINPQDKYRILRALSLIESEGKPASRIKQEFKEQKLPWPCLKVGLRIPKEELLKRVRKRTEKMIQKGLIEEIEILIKKGFQDWRPLSSVGYKEGRLYLQGKIKKENLIEEITSSTMSLAKKQNTWFKRDKAVKWVDWDQPTLKVYKEIFK